MWLADYRPEPPPEPEEIGVCRGCGDVILADEGYCVFEDGGKIHNHRDCKVFFVDRVLGLRR